MNNWTITRNVISKEFLGQNIPKDPYPFDYHELVEKINSWKYILKRKCRADKGESILIGLQILNIDYLAICVASAELSLKIVVVDYSRTDDFQDVEYSDPKTKILSPIDIFLHDFSKQELDREPKRFSKFVFFDTHAKRTYSVVDDFDFVVDDCVEFDKIKDIMPDPLDVLLRCTSSGTTGTPKIVEHTHEFLSKISLRNSKKFSGVCVHTRNLNHGSSLAVYLLPTIMSDSVTKHIFRDLDEREPFDQFIESIVDVRHDLEFIIFPYPFMVDEFIDASIRNNVTWPNLNVQTLSYIQHKPKHAVEQGVFKSITSIFGSNETSGPVFESSIASDNVKQDSAEFKKVDEFYNIQLSDTGLLKVGMPVYHSEIITNDVFAKQGDIYIHKGRSDLVKINGEILDIKVINELNLKYNSVYLVTDSLQNCLYLACWDRQEDALISELTLFFKNTYSRIGIIKVAVLIKKNFMSGIKIDNELLREYFRNSDD